MSVTDPKVEPKNRKKKKVPNWTQTDPAQYPAVRLLERNKKTPTLAPYKMLLLSEQNIWEET